MEYNCFIKQRGKSTYDVISVSVLHPIIRKDQSKCENNDFDNLII